MTYLIGSSRIFIDIIIDKFYYYELKTLEICRIFNFDSFWGHFSHTKKHLYIPIAFQWQLGINFDPQIGLRSVARMGQLLKKGGGENNLIFSSLCN